jgi:hypothetical protein
MLVWLLDHRCCPNMCIMRTEVAFTWLKKGPWYETNCAPKKEV